MEKTVKKHFYEDEKYDENEVASGLRTYGASFDSVKHFFWVLMAYPREVVNFFCILFKLNEKDSIVKTVIKKIVRIFLTIIVYGQCLSIWASLIIIPIFFLGGLSGGNYDHH